MPSPQKEPRTYRKIALTLDDPPLPASKLFKSATNRADAIISEIRRVNGPQAAFFTVGLHIENFGSSDLKNLAEAGHIIANHTYSHPMLSKITVDEFMSDVEKNHMMIELLPGFKPYFRYPYLDMGGREKQLASMKRLSELGYTNAYVTLTTHDWYLNAILLSAQRNNQKIDYDAFGTAYVNTIVDCAEYIANQYDISGMQQPAHILLLHANDVNALYLGKMIETFRKKGWEIIGVDDAYALNIASPSKKLAYAKLAKLQNSQHIPLLDLKHLKELFQTEAIFPKKDKETSTLAQP